MWSKQPPVRSREKTQKKSFQGGKEVKERKEPKKKRRMNSKTKERTCLCGSGAARVVRLYTDLQRV